MHGRASLDRSRERIAAEGKWVFVWRDDTQMNGTELVLSGIALDREKKDSTGEFGLRDGSAGLVGTLIRTDNLARRSSSSPRADLPRRRGERISAVADGRRPLFGVTQISAGTARDAALHATAGVLNAYARQIQETIAETAFFCPRSSRASNFTSM